MQSSTIASIIAFVALATSAIAAPLEAVPITAANVVDYKVWIAENEVSVVSARDGSLQKRAGAIYACNDRLFQLNEGCVRLDAPIGICRNFPNAFIDKISSIGPDEDLICSFFDNTNCQTNHGYIFNVVSPGFNNLEEVRDSTGKNYEDKLASYLCFRR